MEVGNENLDVVKHVNVKSNVENITPHKIAVVAFIREYGLLKLEGKSQIFFNNLCTLLNFQLLYLLPFYHP